MIPETLIKIIKNMNRVSVLTGAGASAESGVPTFREAQSGLWAKYNPQQLATRAAFQENPQLVWDWYRWRRELTAKAAPNVAHIAIAEMANRFPVFDLITQNVDGLHQRAGSQGVIELHGNIIRVKCFDHDHPAQQWAEPREGESPPVCSICGSFLRPDVVWFGESLPASAIQRAFSAAESCELFFSVGTSALVHPAASLPIAAQKNGATLVEINPERTPLTSQADFWLRGAAGDLMPAIAAIV